MKKVLSTHEAKTHLSKVIEAVLEGIDVVICRGKSPVVRVVRYANDRTVAKRPKVGVATSAAVKYEKDAFSPIDSESDLELWGLK